MLKKRVVKLVNMGGIKKPYNIPFFLFNMFNDKHILPIKQPLRSIAALFISLIRSKKTYNIYKQIGESPIFFITDRQVQKLRKSVEAEVEALFIYSKPKLKKDIKNIHIPLYGFYSHTTHGLILNRVKYVMPPFCIYGEFFDFVEYKIKEALSKRPKNFSTAILFSAHSLPESLINKTKDPYKNDLEVFVNYFKKRFSCPVFLSFQSRLGPIKWLEPTTAATVKDLSKAFNCIIIVPISFISDNSETIYEIDIEYQLLADKYGLKCFERVDCINNDDVFIDFLSKQV